MFFENSKIMDDVQNYSSVCDMETSGQVWLAYMAVISSVLNYYILVWLNQLQHTSWWNPFKMS